MTERSFEDLAREFTGKRGKISRPWPSGFLKRQQRDRIASALTGRKAHSIDLFVKEVDGFCCFYAGLAATPTVDQHRRALQRIANKLYHAQDALEELRNDVGLRQMRRFEDQVDPVAESIIQANFDLKFPNWVAYLALGDVATKIRRELSPCWPPHGRQITYVPPTRPRSRKGGRPRADGDDLFTELLAEIAKVFYLAFAESPTTTKTGPFSEIAATLAGAVGLSKGRDVSRHLRAAIKRNRQSTKPRR